MNFIGEDNNFNRSLRKGILDNDYTIVSYVGHKYDISSINGDKFILILPIENEKDYYEATTVGIQKMVESGFTDSQKIYTTIYLFKLDSIDVDDIVDIINNFDKKNLVDNIWVYPKLDVIQLRDNSVENLSWQKLYRN